MPNDKIAVIQVIDGQTTVMQNGQYVYFVLDEPHHGQTGTIDELRLLFKNDKAPFSYTAQSVFDVRANAIVRRRSIWLPAADNYHRLINDIVGMIHHGNAVVIEELDDGISLTIFNPDGAQILSVSSYSLPACAHVAAHQINLLQKGD